MHQPHLQRLAWTTFFVSLLVATGCGKADYEQRMEAKLVGLRHLAKFRPLEETPRQLFTGTDDVTLRLPVKFVQFGTQMTLESKDPNDTNKLLDPRQVQPPFLSLPGFLSSYEQFIPDSSGNKLPYTMYVAAEKLTPLPDGAEKRDPLEETLKKQLLAALPELKEDALQWKNVKCSRPDPASPPKPGVAPTFGTVLWRGIEVDCEQEFSGTAAGGNREFLKLPGTFKLFLYEHKENEETRYFVLLGWRVPKKLIDEAKILPEDSMDQLMNLVGGTIQVVPPPAQ